MNNAGRIIGSGTVALLGWYIAHTREEESSVGAQSGFYIGIIATAAMLYTLCEAGFINLSRRNVIPIKLEGIGTSPAGVNPAAVVAAVGSRSLPETHPQTEEKSDEVPADVVTASASSLRANSGTPMELAKARFLLLGNIRDEQSAAEVKGQLLQSLTGDASFMLRAEAAIGNYISLLENTDATQRNMIAVIEELARSGVAVDNGYEQYFMQEPAEQLQQLATSNDRERVSSRGPVVSQQLHQRRSHSDRGRVSSRGPVDQQLHQRRSHSDRGRRLSTTEAISIRRRIQQFDSSTAPVDATSVTDEERRLLKNHQDRLRAKSQDNVGVGLFGQKKGRGPQTLATTSSPQHRRDSHNGERELLGARAQPAVPLAAAKPKLTFGRQTAIRVVTTASDSSDGDKQRGGPRSPSSQQRVAVDTTTSNVLGVSASAGRRQTVAGADIAVLEETPGGRRLLEQRGSKK